MSSRVEVYCQTFDRYREKKDQLEVTPEVEEIFEDELFELWQSMTVEECREVELRYPELRIARI